MIISRTPHRISFFGGGSDYPEYYLEHGGRVLGAAIDKYCYLNVRRLPPFFAHKHRIVYSRQENVQTLDEIQHPAVRETLKYLHVTYGVSIHHDGDIPARSGMGSSSAFTVGLLKSMLALEGKSISPGDLAAAATHIEQQRIRENVGSQDQVFAAYGGVNAVEFGVGGKVTVTPLIVPGTRLREFKNSLMLFYTGLSRTASDIAAEQRRNTLRNASSLHVIRDLAIEARRILESSGEPLSAIGSLLHEGWLLKRGLSSVITTEHIDALYETARRAGAIGGKLLGAGGGGFMLLYAEPGKQAAVREAMGSLLEIPFGFDYDGSQVIVNYPELAMLQREDLTDACHSTFH